MMSLFLIGCSSEPKHEPTGDPKEDVAYEVFDKVIEVEQNEGQKGKVINVTFQAVPGNSNEDFLESITEYLKENQDQDFRVANFKGLLGDSQAFYLSINKDSLSEVNYDYFKSEYLPNLAELYKPY